MKCVHILLLIVAACAAGCDKPEPQPRPSGFDRKIDGSVPLPPGPSGRAILSGTGLPYTPPPRAAAAAAPVVADATAQVKAIVKEIVAAGQAGQSAKILTYLPPEQAKLLKPLVDIADSVAAARVQVEQLILARFGESYVGRMQNVVLAEQGLKVEPGLLPPTDVEKLTFEAAADTVTVRQPQGIGATSKAIMTFVLTNGHWQMHLADLERPEAVEMLDPNGPLVSMMKKTGDADIQIFNAISQGVQDGTISAENFDARLAAIAKEKMAPVLAEMPTANLPLQAEAGTAPQTQPPAAQPPGGGSQDTNLLEMQMKVHTSLPGMP